MPGKFVVSLDFELLWGVRDHATRESYGDRILGAREAVPQILDLFAKQDVRATWATVGFLFCEGREDLLASLPELRPSYTQSKLSNYAYIDEAGKDEASDPYYFAPSLIDQIAATPGQEIGTHTMSHYYCLEDGQSVVEFEADIDAAIAVASRRSITLRSIVFPRNQYDASHIAACAARGINLYRGNQRGWAYASTQGSGQTLTRRGVRFLDAYSGITGSHAFLTQPGIVKDVPASQFLRPCAGRLSPLHPLHFATIRRNMTVAAKRGQNFHLWWHPHNFGVNTQTNLAGLSTILTHFKTLNKEYGMTSATMADFGEGTV